MHLKVSTGNFLVNLLYLTIAVPVASKGGNQLLYVSKVETQAVSTQLQNKSNISRYLVTDSSNNSYSWQQICRV